MTKHKTNIPGITPYQRHRMLQYFTKAMVARKLGRHPDIINELRSPETLCLTDDQACLIATALANMCTDEAEYQELVSFVEYAIG